MYIYVVNRSGLYGDEGGKKGGMVGGEDFFCLLSWSHD